MNGRVHEQNEAMSELLKGKNNSHKKEVCRFFKHGLYECE